MQPIDLPGREAAADDSAERRDRANVHAFQGTCKVSAARPGGAVDWAIRPAIEDWP